MSKVKHVLGISGGKDSAALAIYLHEKYPQIDFTYYYTDTGKELDETYQLLENIEIYLGKKILHLVANDAAESSENPFDFFYKSFKGYIPSATARWCTNMMKLQPFEKFVGETIPTLSYVGIRGDENREGYISKKNNIQSIFPFRKNMWSEDVLHKLFNPENQEVVLDYYNSVFKGEKLDKVAELLHSEITFKRHQRLATDRQIKYKLNGLMDLGVVDFNHATFQFLKGTEYPLSFEEDYALLDNEDVLVRDDVFRILRESGVGVPAYYNKIEYEVDGQKGEYARSRSGCFFCFFQQKIEWVWLYEQHPEKFKEAMAYENLKESFTWNQHESLEELIHPDRIRQIKLDHLKRTNKQKSDDSPYLLDILDDTEGDGCTACFV
ncbi:phosphoadenosine phosphosulfate reductase family protein [Brumimicrobium oceani]|uniref:Phosphoadenosine phosphosulfate reductase n=1 Tax=Brumimicrobium oceani TaxID=2100725 RepID=A0A2U2XC88_9FLAO|nr:phosphoadenosine phosphosulfate reductase family protein [Brumimicrobium oceani]PWH85414.1 phosphoadenosine phosphosulfate reductase [Brumimicrobium oceani]